MENSKNIIETMNLTDALSSKRSVKCKIVFEGVEIPIRFTPSVSQSSNLIFKFHGSVNRKDPLRKPPVLMSSHPSLALNWHQISISDPTLLRHDDLTISWFSGDRNLKLQAILSNFFNEVRRIMKCDKRIYFGASGGGFAALLYSVRDPGSIALALNPQVSFKNHSAHQSYLDQCWPQVKSIDNLNDFIVHDLSEVYRDSFKNTVIYMQNCTDSNHLYQHFKPFFAAIKSCNRKAPINFIPDVSFWGKLGHTPVPPDKYLLWLDAIAAAKDTSGDAILKARAEHIAQAREARTAAAAPARTPRGFAESDLALADSIAKWSTS